ncbi:sensor domain-containing diguanylate cyclase [Sphingosinicella sp. BN140058]|uniref:GGDEF domain-containing protein n=1 Tax=Sphingosinicella sp. BN140058 TaxID=1892855 RepID=UPI0013EBF1D8|nr:sensor domain-containing diguanylate cyclase [Sphingosinicella sp. BN140058]
MPRHSAHVLAATIGSVPPDLDRLAWAGEIISLLLDAGAATVRQAEHSRKIDALIQQLPLPIVFADHDGEIITNDGAKLLLGLNSGQPTSAELATAMARLINAQGNVDAQRSLMRDPSATVSLETVHNGRAYKVERRSIANDDFSGRLWTFTDITLQRKFQNMATHDALTGALNRRAFDEMIESETERAKRYSQPLSLLAVDLDHFKLVNDKYGHDVGDVVLQEACRRISAAIREVDGLARTGGEEFVVILPATARSGAVDAAQRIKLAIAAMPVIHGDLSIPITASIGVAGFQPESDTVDTFFKRADAALYAAKRAGRNRVELAA